MIVSQRLPTRFFSFGMIAIASSFTPLEILAAALAIDAAELQDTMLWMTDSEVSVLLNGQSRAKVEEELADVLIYALLPRTQGHFGSAEVLRAIHC
jgi:hypothetical protein